MVITIRFIDWFLLVISIIVWALDHWYISYGLSHLCSVGAHFIPHAIHCLCAVILLCTITYLILKSYRDSFLHFSLILFYILSLIFSSYMWNYLLKNDKLLFGLFDMFISIILTICVSVY